MQEIPNVKKLLYTMTAAVQLYIDREEDKFDTPRLLQQDMEKGVSILTFFPRSTRLHFAPLLEEIGHLTH